MHLCMQFVGGAELSNDVRLVHAIWEMSMEVEKVGSCVVIRMKRGENRLNPEFVEAFNKALDKAER